jgi:sugar lactone lactonase YvrE
MASVMVWISRGNEFASVYRIRPKAGSLFLSTTDMVSHGIALHNDGQIPILAQEFSDDTS